MKILTTTLLAALLATLPGAAQTAAELLQKGIFAQETAGDLDAAIQAYRQAVTAAGTQRDVAAQAQYRLAQALLRKGETAQAALEMDRLAREFPDQRDLVARLASAPPGLLRFGVAPPTATEFDLSKRITVQGEVTQLLWVNPRSWLKLKDNAGTEWTIMTAAPNQFLKQNWTRNSLMAGDSITVTAFLAKDGTKTAAADTVIRQSDGNKLFDRESLEPAAAEHAAKQ